MCVLYICYLQQSWSDKMVERVRNVFKRDSKKAKDSLAEPVESEPKRQKKDAGLRRRYPVIRSNTLENADTMQQHRKAISSELGKAKPRDTVLLPLMKSTYGERRMFVLNESTSVQSILDQYPALSRPAVVSLLEICVYFMEVIILMS